MRPPTIDTSSGKQPRAFPISADDFYDRGMLLRDFLAAAALTGLLLSCESGDYAARAYALADAMLKQRKKPAAA
jgi:hypothetical protein